MKIKFIKHSCYTVETENYFLVFDYIGGDLNIPKEKYTIFLVSHRHSDHFSNLIFNFNADLYIISDDVKTEPKNNLVFISPDSELNYNKLRIVTHGSTDEGVSFYVNIEDKGIIHTGDLNYWVWPHYSKEDIENMDRWFKSEIDKFKKENTLIVFMPVDPRLKENYDLTAQYIFKTINAKHYFPMHMWNRLEISNKLKNKYQSKLENKIIHTIEKEQEEFII